MVPHIYIITQNAAQRSSLEQLAANTGFAPKIAPADPGAIPHEAACQPVLILIDVSHAQQLAFSFISAVKAQQPNAAILALSASNDEANAIDAVRLGAADYLALPAHPERFRLTVRNLLRMAVLARELAIEGRKLAGEHRFDDIIAASPEMVRAVDVAKRAAAAKLPILIEGENGTEKEAIARAIHALNRPGQPFVRYRVSPAKELLEGTDAGIRASAQGPAGEFGEAVRSAAGGTLFIDDVGCALPAVQAQILMFLKERQKALHSDMVEKSMPRLICATSHNLIQCVKEGEFSEALFYKLNVMPVWLPPLRNRGQDIAALAVRFAVRSGAELGKRIDGIDEAALQWLRRHTWPGNLRELETVVFRAALVTGDSRISLRDLPHCLAQLASDAAVPASSARLVKPGYDGPAMIGGSFPSLERFAMKGRPGQQHLGIPALNDEGDIRPLHSIESDLIRIALGHYRGHMTEIARKLGIGRSTLYRKMREFGLDFRVH